MMENNSTPSPDPVPEASPIAVPVPAESAVTPPPAPPVIPLRERPNAPLLHKGFQNLFRLVTVRAHIQNAFFHFTPLCCARNKDSIIYTPIACGGESSNICKVFWKYNSSSI